MMMSPSIVQILIILFAICDGQISDELRRRLKSVYITGCGSGSGCVGLPDGCIKRFMITQHDPQPETCAALLTWMVDQLGNFRYGLTGHLPTGFGYVAMGFSDDRQMGKDSIVGCFMNTGGSGTPMPTISRFVNPQGHSGNIVATNPNLGLGERSTEYFEEHIFCTFNQLNHNLPFVINVDIQNSSYYIHLATAPTVSPSGLHYHTSKITSSQKINIHDNNPITNDPIKDSAVANFSTKMVLIILFTICLLL